MGVMVLADHTGDPLTDTHNDDTRKGMNDLKRQPQRPSWREYQRGLKRPVKRAPRRRLVLALAALSVVLLCVYMGWPATGATNVAPTTAIIERPSDATPSIGKKDVQLLLSRVTPNDLLAEQVELPFREQRFTVETSLDETLQERLIQALDRKNSRYIGVVVMEPDSGRILAMAGFDKADPQANPCLRSTFPAASLFKIVTAAAAVDQCGYSSNTTVRFNGYKHTLYKSQLKETRNRYTHAVSFGASFAESINPVFGKLGQLHLGKRALEEYALGFGFNQDLDFELHVPPSHLAVRDTPYHWAEIASGFNNETTISPIHGAVMTACILNEGRMVSPIFVERIMDPEGREIYAAHASWEQRAMTTRASTVLKAMMEKTVQSGTARKTFRGSQRDPILSRLRMGGKTGSISNRAHDQRFDWFVGFAQDKNGPGKLVVASLVAHEAYIGVRAGTYARMAFSHYFKGHWAQQNDATARSKANG